MTLPATLRSLLLIASLLFAGGGLHAQEPELLPPEQAFALTARTEGDTLVASYRIAPGYYLYRDRFEFQVERSDAPTRFGMASIPAGKIKFDEFFGEMEVYRNQVEIRLPLVHDGARASQLLVRAVSQGCADIGVCYPPLKQALDVDLASTATIIPAAWNPAAAEPASVGGDVDQLKALLGQVTDNLQQRQAQFNEVVETGPRATLQNMGVDPADNVSQLQALLGQASGNLEQRQARSAEIAAADPMSALQSLGAEIGLDNEDEILHPDQAFILSARLDANDVIQTNILMAKNIYVYRDKIKVAMVESNGHAIGAIALPRGKSKVDEFFGPTEVFYGAVDIPVPILSSADASGRFVMSYQYQGCVEDRICYPPVTKFLDVDANQGLIRVVAENPAAGAAATRVAGAAATSPQAPLAGSTAIGVPATPVSEQEQFAQILQDKSLLLVIGLFFLAGIGLTFTPCVFPMIPILSSIIAGQGEDITTRKAFTLSLVYVLSMAVTYAIVGAIVGYYGAEFNIQIWFQDPIILSVFAGLFVLLSLSMFGFYELQMPNALQSRLTAISNSQQGGQLAGVGLMGLFSAIIVGPCITAPLVGALIFISQTQNWMLGGLALFALGLGMGVPLMLVGTSAGKLLPRAGAWMDKVKAGFGVVLLGVAVWLLERILPTGITMALIAALMIGSAIYLGALDSLGDAASGWRRFAKSVGLVVLVYGVAYLVGAAAGSNDLIQPLRGIITASASGPAGERQLVFRPVKGRPGLERAIDASAQVGTPAMLDFYADWCISCKEMKKYAFTHPGVLTALDGISLLQADVTHNDALDTELMASLGIYGPPAILFFDGQGNEIRHRRVVGFMSGEKFAAHVVTTLQ